jgi:RNA polymerase sigma-70 factor (ECF subfamily)
MSQFETRSTLLERVRDPRDSRSWQEFVQIYEPLLTRFVLARGVSRSDTEDLVQEVFATLFRALQNFQLDHSRGKFRTWLWQVSRNVMVDWARRQKRDQRAVDAWAEQLGLDQNESLDEWSLLHKQRIIEILLPRLQENTQPKTWSCFEEHLQKGRPAADVAEELGLTSNAVYVNASRVLNRLRDQCREYDEELGDA